MKTRAPILPVALVLLPFFNLQPTAAFCQVTDFSSRVGLRPVPEAPVYFEENVGQADPAVKFLAHGCHASLLLTRDAAWLSVQGGDAHETPLALRLGLAGASPAPEPAGLNPLPGRVNYFIGDSVADWHANVPAFARVKYADVYPGIDLIYHGNQERLEYDFFVRPGADPNRIELEFGGVENLNIEQDGDLQVQLPGGSVRLCKPTVYQEIAGVRRNVSGSFVIRAPGRIGFRVSDYDHARALVIDPVLAYSFTLGGSGGPSQGLAIALDTNDDVYVTGNTMAPNFPISRAYQSNFTGPQDVFVAEFDTNGAMLFSTFLGGNGVQSGQGIAVDVHSNIFVSGYTSATNFPTLNALQATNGGGYDAFVTELSVGGAGLIFSTYLGGTGFDAANGIALDTNDSPIVTGYTQSTNFPTSHAAQPAYGGNGDSFVAKLNPGGGTLVYSTYLGGNDSENNGTSSDIDPVASLGDVLAHLGGAVAVDLNANAYVTGWTFSTNFPVLHAWQATNNVYSPGYYSTPYVAQLDPSGNLVYSTYFGGGYSDMSRTIGVDLNGNVYFAGSWYGYDLPATNAYSSYFNGSYGSSGTALGDGFIAALDATGTNLIWCTFLGGIGDEQINGISVRPDGAVAVTGWTDSPNFPLINPIQGPTEQGIFKSTTGGNAWTARPAGIFPVFVINVDPLNPADIYLISRGGLFQSTNSGAGFVQNNFSIYSPAQGGSSQNVIAFDPLHEGVLYAGAYTGVFKTTNNGVTWTTLTNGLPPSPGIQALAVDPHVPSTIYAGTFTGIAGLSRSTNGGNSWSDLNNGLPSYVITTSLLVDPLNSSNVYEGLYYNFFGSALNKSTDGGNTWNTVNALPSFGQGVMAMASDPANPTNLYVLLGGGDASAALCRTTDGGIAWSNLLVATNQNLTTLAVAAPSQPVLEIAHATNNLSLFWPASFTGYALQFAPRLNSPQWTNVTQTSQVIGANNVVTLSSSSTNGFYRLAYTNSAPLQPTLYVGTDQTGGQGVLRSADGGSTWNAVGLAGQTVNAVAAGPTSPDTVYAGLAASYDAFVATYAPPPNRYLYFSTYLGGSGADQGNAIALDFETAFVTGSTHSPDFPTTHAPGLVRPRTLTVRPGAGPGEFALDFYIAQLVRDLEDCPSNEVYNVTYHVGQNVANTFYSPAKASTVDVGNLPPGISFRQVGLGLGPYPSNEGEIIGAPTATGPYTFIINFYDGECTWSYTFNITVEN